MTTKTTTTDACQIADALGIAWGRVADAGNLTVTVVPYRVTTVNTTEIGSIIARLRELEEHYDGRGYSDFAQGLASGLSSAANALAALVDGEPWRPGLDSMPTV